MAQMDVPGSLGPTKVAELMGLTALCGSSDGLAPARPWQVIQSNALDGFGVDDGLAWLADQIKRTSL